MLFAILLFSSLHISSSIDNGLGVTPPLGWRSWNCYHGNINQSLIKDVVDAVIAKDHMLNGKPTSLWDIGYRQIGVDDNWQKCDSTGHNFHDKNGNPVLNTDRFPDLTGLVNYCHSKNVKIGWYFNNCICRETGTPHFKNDVAFLRKYNFDGVKLDGCGSSKNISYWSQLINETDKTHPMLTENCHNGPNYATLDWCPMNFFRTSTDINPSWGSIIGNLQTTIKYQNLTNPIARPGCWPYPDMLEVGNMHTTTQDRSHFGAWCVVSAPLILGYDLTNKAKGDKVWDIISNMEAISVNQQWAGHPGRLISQAKTTVRLKMKPDGFIPRSSNEVVEDYGDFPNWQIWGKKLPNNKFAVLFVNIGATNPVDLTVKFSDIGMQSTLKGRDIWNHKDLGTFSGSFTAKAVANTDSAFIILSQ